MDVGEAARSRNGSTTYARTAQPTLMWTEDGSTHGTTLKRTTFPTRAALPARSGPCGVTAGARWPPPEGAFAGRKAWPVERCWWHAVRHAWH